MICRNCQAEVPDLSFCPHCGYRLDDQVGYPSQEHNPHGKPSRPTRWRRIFRRWVLPFAFLGVVISFGVLGLALIGFRDGMEDRNLATQHQAEIHYNRGLIYLRWEQYQLAEAEFEEALRLVPNYTEAGEERRVAQVKQTVAPSPTPPPTPTFTPTPTIVVPTPTAEVVIIPVTQALFEQGEAHYRNQEWEQAVARLEQLRSEDVAYRSDQVVEMLFQSHRNYGIELEEQENLEEAISHYDSALYLRRRDPEIEELRQSADLYIKALGVWNVDWERVITNLTALYALAPDYRDAAERLYRASTTHAQSMVGQEQYCAAAELYEQALEIRDDDPEIIKLEDDTRHLCQVTGPVSLGTPAANGSRSAGIHVGTLVASCYDQRTNQYNLCAQNAEDNVLHTWITQAEQPAITLDGKALAYRSTDPERPGLYAMSFVTSTVISGTITGGKLFTITTEAEGYYPTWSPDGTRVAYSQYDAEKEDWFIHIAYVGLTGSTPRIHQGEWPSWGPNDWLAFTTCSGENACGIHIFNPPSWELRRLTDTSQDRAAAWSTSGDEIVYMSDIGRSSNLYVAHIELHSVTIRQITRNLFSDGMPVWSPDGQRIAYVTNRDDDWSVYTLHPYGDQARRIVSLGAESADWLRFQLAWVAQVIQFSPTP